MGKTESGNKGKERTNCSLIVKPSSQFHRYSHNLLHNDLRALGQCLVLSPEQLLLMFRIL